VKPLSLRSLGFAAVWCLLGSLSWAQIGGLGPSPQRITIKEARIEPAQVPIGGEATLLVTVSIEEGWHIYSIQKAEFQEPTTFKIVAPEGVEIAGPVKEPKPHIQKNDFGDTIYHEGEITFRVPIRFAKSLTGRQTVRVRMGYMACDASGCEPPTSESFKARVELVPATSGTDQAERGDGEGTGAISEVALRHALEDVLDPKISALREDLESEIESLKQTIQPLIPEVPEPLPEPPSLDGMKATLEVVDKKIRAGETAALKLHIESPEPVDPGRLDDFYMDVGDSERIQDVEAVSVTRSEDGLSLDFVLEVQAKSLARSGKESRDVAVSIPLQVEGLEFEKELDGLHLELEFGLPSLWAWVLKAAVAALLALLTPCVFPMIPVTVSFFTKQAERKHENPLVLPTVYVVGIVVSFVAIGAGVTAIFKAQGVQALATNGWVQGAFGVLFILFSLSLFGMFALKPPAFLMARAGKVQGKGGLTGTLGMGLLFSLTSFTCTAPLVGAILVDAAQSGEWQLPIIGMFVFSFVLAIPFFFLSLFPRLLSSMPKSGGWMNRVKVTLGFLEMAFSFKFIGAMDAYFGWGVFTRDVILWIWVGLFLMNAVYLLGFIAFPHDGKVERAGPAAGSIAIVLLVFALFLSQGAQGRRMPYLVESLMPPALEHEQSEGKLGWEGRIEDNWEAALEEATTRGVALFVDFTGFT